jgi:pimeloyl-ACP methyl ester carboxylesterase
MSIINRRSLSDLRGVVRLATEATVGVTDLVEKMHHTIQLGHAPLGASRAANTGGLTGLIYRGIRGTTRLVGGGLDAAMAPVNTLLPEHVSSTSRDAFVSAINGVYGDHLFDTNNPLAIQMSLRHAGQDVDPDEPDVNSAGDKEPQVTGNILLFVHGLGLNEGHWSKDDCNRGQILANDLGYTALYLRYNSGLAIADNGRELASIMERLMANWPVPVNELVIVGHSMGGLLTRSACLHGAVAGHDWLRYLQKMVFIGSPHHGAPLERGSNVLDFAMDLSPYLAPFTGIAKKRSAGITDLRHGCIASEKRQFVPLPTDVECYVMASVLGKKRRRMDDKLVGDGLVPVDSALGRNNDPARTLQIPESHQWVGYETGHLALLSSPEVYKQLHDWLK